MSNALQHMKLERDSRGVVNVIIDVRDAPMNVFNVEVAAELLAVVEQLERDPPKLALFRSGKASGFFAGADVKHIQRLRTEADVHAVVAAGQELFSRIERLPFPTIAVIHGPCLGGGLEFALACKFRIARDDASTKLGLPEVMLGLIPGWGGTQRLPRTVGLQQALRMILEGSTLTAAKAAKAGLVDSAISPATFDAEVERFVAARLAGQPVARPRRKFLDLLLNGTALGRAIVFRTVRKHIAKRGAQYPALPAALRAVAAGDRNGIAAGLAAEQAEFAALVFTPVARNLIELFFQRERARKLSTWVGDVVAQPVSKVAVIGAGVMGAGIAQLLAVSKYSVVLNDISAEIVTGGRKKVEALTADAVKKGAISQDEAAAVLQNVTATHEWDALAACDLAIEAVVEREDIKRQVFTKLAEQLPANAVLASNTSALSVSRIAEAVASPQRVAGLHFFNPVHRMHLVEVVKAAATDEAAIAALIELVRKLGKVPIVVADSPGFLVNRILFPYLDEAVRLVSEGVAGADVDREAVRFGMPMGPLELLDTVGIDVAAHVAASLAGSQRDPGPTPERLATMARDGFIGKKAGRGFYTYANEKRGTPTRWAIPTAAEHSAGDVQQRLIHAMMNEAAKCLTEGVVEEPWMVDLAMVLGTGFAPYRGGPLRTADSIGLPRLVRELDELAKRVGPRFEPCPSLRALAASGRGFYTEPAVTSS